MRTTWVIADSVNGVDRYFLTYCSCQDNPGQRHDVKSTCLTEDFSVALTFSTEERAAQALKQHAHNRATTARVVKLTQEWL